MKYVAWIFAVLFMLVSWIPELQIPYYTPYIGLGIAFAMIGELASKTIK